MAQKMSKKFLSIVSIILLFMVSFTILGGTLESFESIKKGVLDFFAKNTDGTPLHVKTLDDNHDGTYRISLNVTGDSEKTYNNANVIVVFDVSGSMGFCTNTNSTCSNANNSRLTAAKNAVNNLANSLLSKNTTDHPNTIEMALVSFSTTATIAQNKTNSYSTFSTAINNLRANGGTNWEAALQKVLDVNFGDNDQTYVIFVSDGNPTFRTTRNGYNDQYQTGVYGNGQETSQNISRCYETATDDAKAIVDKGYEFYTIGIYGNVDRMKSLTTASGKTEENYYAAADTAALQTALNDILEKIERAGFGEVSISDGTTKQVKATSGDLVNKDMLEVDESTYKYTLTIPVTGNGPYTYDKYTLTVNGDNVTITWKDNNNNNKTATYTGRKQGNDIILEWSDTRSTEFYKAAPKGELVAGAVEWDLNSLGVLLNDVTYTISFDVYPAQVTLDLIADFKNNPSLYDNLKDDDPVKKSIKKVVSETGEIEYKLRTNTDAELTYTDTRNNAGSKTEKYDNPEPVSTVSAEMMAISKDYKDYLKGTKPEITLYIDRDSEFGHYNVLLNSTNGYTDNRYISVGIMVVDETAGTVSIKTPGHDYKFSEDSETAHNWELEGDTCHPMLINNSPTMLVKIDESKKPSGMNGNFYNDNGTKYYKIGNYYYKATAAESASLTATNYRRGYMDVVKHVDGLDAPKDAEFTYNATWTTGDSKDFYFSIYDPANKIYIRNGSKTYVSGPVTETIQEKEGVEEVYYFAPSGSTVTITVQAGWSLRFINLPVNSEYTIVEDESKMPPYFQFEKVEGTKQIYTKYIEQDSNEEEPAIVPEGSAFGATGIKGEIKTDNTKYFVDFNNTYTKTHIDLTKVWEDNNDQDGIRPDSVKVYVIGEIETENGREVVVPSKEYTISKPEETEDPNTWTVKYEDLERFYQGKEIIYSIQSEKEIDGYNTKSTTDKPQPLIQGTKITNYHEPEVIDISVTKDWQDDNNRDGVRLDSIKVQLYAGKSSQGGEITLDKDNNWSYTYEGLPAYADGEEIIYSVKELGTEIDEETNVETILGSDNESIYVVTISGDKDKGFTVTNKHENDTISVTVTKDWQDDENRDGVRPASVRVQVFDEEGKAVGDPYTLTQADNWTHTFTGLIKNKNGKAIEYTVKELGTEIDEETKVETILGSDNESIYVVTISGDKDKGFTVTNKHENDTTEVTVTKDWQDENNRDGVRPASVRVQVFDEEGKAVGDPYTLTQADNWTHTFTGLVKNKNGKAIEYTVKELDTQENAEGKEVILGTDNKSEYVVTISGDKESGFTVTNKHTPNMIEVTVVKDWQDDNDRDDVRPEELKVTLYNENDNSIAGETTLKADATGTWSHTFTVPKYEAGKQGVLINYNADEDEVPEGYIHDKKENTKETDEDGNCTITIHNKHENDTIDVKVTKKWEDGENRDNSRPEIIYVQLYAGSLNNPVGQPVGIKEKDGIWTYTFTGLTKNESGTPIEYIVKELGTEIDEETNVETINFVKGEKSFTYTVTESGDMTNGYEITNTYTPEITSVKVTKEWQDGDNQDGSRPDPENVSVELLYENGESVGQVVVLSESNQWTQSFTNLPKNADGKEIVYKVKEMGTVTDEDGVETLTVSKNKKEYIYTVTTEGNQKDGYKIINSYTPEPTELKIEKVWNDDDNRDNVRPDSITVVLDADQEIAEKGQKLTLSPDLVDPETKNWIGTFTNLPKYHNGVEINYSVSEIDVDTEKYSVDISEIVDGKITITNTHEIATKDIPVEKIWQDGNNQDDSRPDSITVVLYAGEGENKQEVKRQEILKEKFKPEENWSCIFEDLPIYDKGQEITYTVGELGTVKDENGVETLTVSRNGQTFVYTVTVKGNIIYNSSNLTIPINGVKTWVDDNDRDGLRPDTITVNLYADGVKIDSRVVDAFGDGKYDFGERPKYKEGQPILYVISEESVDGYSTVVEGYDITNTHELETVNIVGTKVWNDDDDRDSLRPENVTIILYAGEGENKKEVDSVPAQKVVTEDSDGNEIVTWKFEFKNKLKYENKEEIYYTVGDNVEGYEFELGNPDIDEDNNTITYELINNHTPETIQFNITKNWDDYEDEDGARPDSITVYLYADGELIDTVIINSENGWKYSTDELKRYKKTADGEKKEIEYTIVEKEIEGYGSRIDTTIIENDNNKDGKVINNSITNSHMPTIDIEGQKFWEDFDNKYDSRPKEITIYLYKKDELYMTITVSSEKDWKYVIENLDKYAGDEEITYTIREEAVEGYETTIDGYNIVNKLIWNEGDAELPPQTGFEIKIGEVLYLVIGGVLFKLGQYLRKQIEA